MTTPTPPDAVREVATMLRELLDHPEGSGRDVVLSRDVARFIAEALLTRPSDARGREESEWAKMLAESEANALRWREYAEHQEHCATCGEAVGDCEEGSELRRFALSAPQEGANNG